MTALVIIGLAAWRLALLLTSESGPWGVLQRFRHAVGVPTWDSEEPGEGFFPTLFSCMWCATAWTAVGVYGLYLLEPRVVLVIAAWGVAIILDRFVGSR